MKILLIGSGGREHALAWKIAQSPRLSSLYTLPGNPGTAQSGENLPGDPHDLDAIVRAAREKAINLVVVGPEVPLAAGLADRLCAVGIPVFGPSAGAARIEASKAFAKDFMTEQGIPTARYQTFIDFESARDALRSWPEAVLPVIKASGLAAGKGVLLPATLAEAEAVLRAIMLEGKFGAAGAQVVLEERLTGREVSVLAFTDGTTVLPMPPAQDHKRLLDGDAGPNTGGMGVFAPSPFAPPPLVARVVAEVLQPAVDGLRARGMPYVGVLYAGLILTPEGPKVLEFNCRFGDPETQVLLPLLESDLVALMQACVEGCLAESAAGVRWRPAASVCVVLASGGYPGAYRKGLPINGLDDLPAGVVAFHAGTRLGRGALLTNGGRVMGITALAPSLAEARTLAYEGVSRVTFEGMHFRKDIAKNWGADRSVRAGDRVRRPSAYAACGVRLDAGNRAVTLMKEAVRGTFTPGVLSDVGAFGGLFSAAVLRDYADPVLVATTDGVGTKVVLAAQAGRFSGVGRDIVQHCINDLLVQGARPLFFLDYIASDRLVPEQVAGAVRGMAEACREAKCALLGGETAEMPGVYTPGHFDVAGTMIGVVDRPLLLPRPAIRSGDCLVGLASSGPHTNGYSLIRRAFAGIPLDHRFPELDRPLGDVLLEPHRSYLPLLGPLISQSGHPIKALVHITGGGFFDNLPRVFPEGCGARLFRGAWPVPPVFPLLQRLGEVAEDEMYRVFNMGIGLVAVVAPEETGSFQQLLPEESWVIGEVTAGTGVTLAGGR